MLCSCLNLECSTSQTLLSIGYSRIFSETSSLDNAMLDKKFIDFAKKTRDDHREKSMKWKKIGSVKLPIPSQIDQQLYEVFAELVDIIDQKLTKRSQSLLFFFFFALTFYLSLKCLCQDS